LINLCRWILLVTLLIAGPGVRAQVVPLRLVQTIPLAGVEGRIDHLAIDARGQRLFVAALGNNTVEVIDLAAGKRLHTLSGLHEPQGVAYAPAPHAIYVANGRGGALTIFSSDSYNRVASIPFSDDADNVRYDPRTNRLYVGFGAGALGVLDATFGRKVGAVVLSGHPEAFEIEEVGPRIYVNVPSASQIAVVDRAKNKRIATWPLTGARANFPMALDEAGHRLFVGCREPAVILVYDTRTGKRAGSFEMSGDADDLFYDAARQRVYASCGAGFLDAFQEREYSHFERIQHLPTAPGARTSLLVPALNRLYLAVPHRGSQPAEIRVFAVQP
jgi:DNA-binding beta-propeller fold protein YncE